MLTRESGGAPASVGTAPLDKLEFAPFECVTGPFLRVTLTVGREPGEPPAPPTVHSFLAPINITASGALDFPIETPFRDPVDEPAARDLPDL